MIVFDVEMHVIDNLYKIKIILLILGPGYFKRRGKNRKKQAVPRCCFKYYFQSEIVQDTCKRKTSLLFISGILVFVCYGIIFLNYYNIKKSQRSDARKYTTVPELFT